MDIRTKVIEKLAQLANKYETDEDGFYKDTLSVIKQFQAEIETLKESLKANIKYCDYFDGETVCNKIARWGAFDYVGEEYYCDKHKCKKTTIAGIKELPNNRLAEQALKGE